MKKADNFDASKWLTENKITTQSRLNEDSKSISLTPEQKKEFKSSIRDLKKMEDFEYALGEAGNVLANILTNGEAEFIEDVEDFGYDAEEVEQYAMELAGGSRLNEMATMIKKNSPFGSEKPLQVDDTIMWKTYSNDDRGMGSSVSGRLIGKVVKILGTANLQAEDIKTGDLYKVSRTELTRVPNVGDKIEATASYNFGAGSGSQGSNKISGIVKKVNLEKFSIIIQTENSDKLSIIDLKDLSDVKIY